MMVLSRELKVRRRFDPGDAFYILRTDAKSHSVMTHLLARLNLCLRDERRHERSRWGGCPQLVPSLRLYVCEFLGKSWRGKYAVRPKSGPVP